LSKAAQKNSRAFDLLEKDIDRQRAPGFSLPCRWVPGPDDGPELGVSAHRTLRQASQRIDGLAAGQGWPWMRWLSIKVIRDGHSRPLPDIEYAVEHDRRKANNIGISSGMFPPCIGHNRAEPTSSSRSIDASITLRRE